MASNLKVHGPGPGPGHWHVYWPGRKMAGHREPRVTTARATPESAGKRKKEMYLFLPPDSVCAETEQ
eukprot:3557548-Rhodomonas_salina.1